MTAQTVSAAVARRDEAEGPVTLMWSRRKHFAAVLPESIDVDAFMGTAAGALYADADLMAAARRFPESLIVTMMRCAALGHMPGTDEFYLHIRKGKVAGTEGYRGVIERMYRSGAVAKVVVSEVCASDPFRYVQGVDDKPVHRTGGEGTTGADFFGAEGHRNRGAMVGVYAYAELTTGAISRVVVMDRDDVMAARESSDAKDTKFSPWNRLDGGKDHPELTGRSMWWKTAAKRLEPWVPTSAEYRREQLRASAAAAGGPAIRADVPPELPSPVADEILDAEIVEETPPQPAAPRQRRQVASEPDPPSGAPSAPASAEGAARQPRAPGQTAPSGAPGMSGGDERGPALLSSGQLSLIQINWKRLGWEAHEREERLVLTGRLAGVGNELETTSDLTQEQASAVLEVLKTCETRDDVHRATRPRPASTGQRTAREIREAGDE